jgi:hypothetical protein
VSLALAIDRATAKMGPPVDVEASLLSGAEAMPTAERIAAATRQLEPSRKATRGGAVETAEAAQAPARREPSRREPRQPWEPMVPAWRGSR